MRLSEGTPALIHSMCCRGVGRYQRWQLASAAASCVATVDFGSQRSFKELLAGFVLCPQNSCQFSQHVTRPAFEGVARDLGLTLGGLWPRRLLPRFPLVD